jgi:dienelactone hydrolase
MWNGIGAQFHLSAMRPLLSVPAVALLAAAAQAQAPRFVLPVDTSAVDVTMNHQYATSDTVALKMDVYRQKGAPRAGQPALIFFNRATGANRSGAFYLGWARAAASRGVVAVLPDLRDGREAQDFRLLVRHLVEHGAELGINPEALTVYAASGNVFAGFPAVEDPAMTGIKAAVMYYGSAPISTFRLDLPVLYVRAGLDRPALNRDITTLAAVAVSQNAPLVLLNHSSGYHGFEWANDDDATRDVIEQTLAFVKRVTAPGYRTALRAGIAEATAAGHVISGKFGDAATVYREMLTTRPDDARLRLSFGEALLGDSQFAAACAEFEKLKGKGLGPRDLGLPAARACMQKGDPDAAIAWLKSIPTRFLPTQVRSVGVFAPLQSRADFVALFPSR